MAGRCVEMVGGAGFVKEFPVEKYYRDSKIGEGTEYSGLVGLQRLLIFPLQVRSMKARLSSNWTPLLAAWTGSLVLRTSNGANWALKFGCSINSNSLLTSMLYF